MEQQEPIAADEWQAPPPPPPAQLSPETGKTMTLGQTLTGIFFEPGKTFEALRIKPRFLVATLICAIVLMAFQIGFIQKLGYENIVRQQINNNPQTAQMSPEQRAQAIALYNNSAMKTFIYVTPIFYLLFVFGVGALLYWGASSAFGGSANFWQSLALVVYSSLPFYVITMLLNIVVLLLKPSGDIDPVAAQRGLISANPGILIDPKASPLAATLLGSLDLFVFYGMFLAALGFQKIARLSAASAWTIVIVFWVITIVFRVAGTLASGAAM